MTTPTCSEPEFIALVSEYGPAVSARKLGISERRIYERIARIEARDGIQIPRPLTKRVEIDVPGRLIREIKNGISVVGSDAHYWPGIITTAHRALVRFIKEFRPVHVAMNGDASDGARISRHAPIGWESRPTLQHEIEACKDRMGEVEQAYPEAERDWPLGNHDARFESRLAQQCPEYANLHGMHLKDHFPHWNPCWSVWINDTVVIKHRGKGGIHATHNNTVSAGKSMVTGHLHSLKVTPWTDYNGDRWGVDTGTLAEPFGPQFTDYMEDGPRNWRSGFAVLTFKNYELLQPELVRVVRPGVVDFRGRLWDI